MARKPARKWTWRQLLGDKPYAAPRMRQAEYIRNAEGLLVKAQAAHPRTAAIERFVAMTRRQGECIVFTGGDTFRVSDDEVTTPRRFLYQAVTGEVLTNADLIFGTCQTPNCVRVFHLEKRTLRDKALYKTE